jgi:DNA transformation protein
MAERDAANEFTAYLQDQLRAWGPVSFRRMFGGHGLYRGDIMFGLVLREALFLRADAANRDAFAAAGMSPFRYDRQGKSVALAFYEVPADLLEEPEALAPWADTAYAAALRVAAAKPRKKPAAAAAKAKSIAAPAPAAPREKPRKRRGGDKSARQRLPPGE